MAGGRSIRAGRAFVEIDGEDRKLIQVLNRAERRLRSFGRLVTSIGAIGLGAAAAFAPLGIAAVRAASTAEESLSRFAAVFGRETEAAAAFAEDLARRVGRSSLEIKDGLATFQSFFVGLGFDGSEARELSQSLLELSVDFASFNNISDDEALGRFISALSGSSEVLDRFGVNTKQAALQQELLRMGITKSWSAVTEQEKAIARLNIIMRTMTDQGSMGDAERTAGSFANQMKRVGAEVRDTAVAIGQALVPYLKPVVTLLGQVLAVVRELVQQNPALVAGVFAAATALGVFSAAILLVGIAASIASVGLGGLAAVMGVVLSPIGAAIAIALALTAGVVALGIAILKYTGVGANALNILRSGFAALAGTAQPAINAIREALMAGDVAAAADVLWAGLQVVWELGKQGLIATTVELGVGIVNALADAMVTAQTLFAQATTAIMSFWLRMVDQITGTNIASTIGSIFNAGISVLVAQGVAEVRALEAAVEGLGDANEGIASERINRARRNLEAAIRAAQQSAQESREQSAQESREQGGGFDLPGFGAAVRNASSSAGGFVALGGRAFSAENAAERTARAAENLDRTTKRIQRDLEQGTGGMVFT